jgi:hypothetical protein
VRFRCLAPNWGPVVCVCVGVCVNALRRAPPDAGQTHTHTTGPEYVAKHRSFT